MVIASMSNIDQEIDVINSRLDDMEIGVNTFFVLIFCIIIFCMFCNYFILVKERRLKGEWE